MRKLAQSSYLQMATYYGYQLGLIEKALTQIARDLTPDCSPKAIEESVRRIIQLREFTTLSRLTINSPN